MDTLTNITCAAEKATSALSSALSSSNSNCSISTTSINSPYWSLFPEYPAVAHGKEKMPDNSKTVLYEKQNRLYVKTAGKDGYLNYECCLMQDIEDITVVEHNGEPRSVIVTFKDNTTEKATVQSGDVFYLENGISICIAKHLISQRVGTGHGSSVYNKIIERCLKIKHRNDAKRIAEEEEKNRVLEKRKKLAAKKQAKRKKRMEEERERQIEIQKEAYLRALHEFNTRPAY